MNWKRDGPAKQVCYVVKGSRKGARMRRERRKRMLAGALAILLGCSTFYESASMAAAGDTETVEMVSESTAEDLTTEPESDLPEKTGSETDGESAEKSVKEPETVAKTEAPAESETSGLRGADFYAGYWTGEGYQMQLYPNGTVNLYQEGEEAEDSGTWSETEEGIQMQLYSVNDGAYSVTGVYMDSALYIQTGPGSYRLAKASDQIQEIVKTMIQAEESGEAASEQMAGETEPGTEPGITQETGYETREAGSEPEITEPESETVQEVESETAEAESETAQETESETTEAESETAQEAESETTEAESETEQETESETTEAESETEQEAESETTKAESETAQEAESETTEPASEHVQEIESETTEITSEAVQESESETAEPVSESLQETESEAAQEMESETTEPVSELTQEPASETSQSEPETVREPESETSALESEPAQTETSIEITFTVQGSGSVTLTDSNGNAIGTVRADAACLYEGTAGETISAFLRPEGAYLPFAVYRSAGESMEDLAAYETASLEGVSIDLSLTDSSEEIAFAFLSDEEYVTWSNNAYEPMILAAAAANAGTWDNPKEGDVYTGSAVVSGATAGYSSRRYYGDNNATLDNYVKFTCTSGELLGDSFWPTHCESGHNYLGPEIGVAGTYYVRVYQVDSDGTYHYYFYFQPNASGTYQRVSGYGSGTPVYGKLAVQKKIFYSSADYATQLPSGAYDDLTCTFGVYSDADCKNLVETITTNASGYGESSENLIIGQTYYLKETKAPRNCMLQTKVYEATVSTTTSTKITVYDRPYSVRLAIKKVDESTGAWKEDLSGTQISLYSSKSCKDSSLIETITITDEDGASFKTVLAIGKTYYYKETYATDHYALDEKVYTITPAVSSSDEVDNLGTKTVTRTLKNTPTQNIRFRVKKEYSNLSPEIANLSIYSLADIEYTYYRDKDCTRKIDSVETKENGYSSWMTIDSEDETNGDLASAGRHTIYLKETSGNRSVAISSKVYKITYTVEAGVDSEVTTETTKVSDVGVVGYGLLVQKYEQLTDKTTPLEGVQITVNYADAQQGADITTRTWVFLTDKNGQVTTDTAAAQLDPDSPSDPLFYDNDNNVCWPRGYYTIQETKGLEGYEWDNKTYSVTVRSDPKDRYLETAVFTAVNIYNHSTEGKAYIAKESSDTSITENNAMYSLAGAVFEVRDSKGAVAATLTTDAAGKTPTVALNAGTYTVKETTAPAGYKRSTETKTLVVTAGKTSYVTFADEPVVGTMDLLIQKNVEGVSNVSLADAQFRVEYFDNLKTGGTAARTWVFKTDTDGKVKLADGYRVSGDALYKWKGACVLPLGSIRVTEIKAPAGLKICEEAKTFAISQDGDAAKISIDSAVKFTDERIFGGVKIRKADIESGISQAQGNGSLAGAVYGIYNNSGSDVVRKEDLSLAYAHGMEVAQITTNENGEASLGAVLQAGSYVIKEISPSEGYRVNRAYSQTFTITKDGEVADLTGVTADEPPIRGGFTVAKKDLNTWVNLPQGDASLEGAEFTLYNTSAGYVMVDTDGNGLKEKYESGSVIAVFATDAEGTITTDTDYLPYGSYRLVETAPPAGYKLEGRNLTWEFSIQSEGVLVTPDKEEQPGDLIIKGGFSITKEDYETKDSSPQGDATVAGAIFTLYNLSSNAVMVDGTSYAAGEAIGTFVTGADGTVTTADDYLPYGTYRLVETQPPEGYTGDGANLDLTFTIRTDKEMFRPADNTKQPQNKAVRGGFEVYKWDQELNEQYQTQGDATLEGAEFTLTNLSENYVLVDTNGDGARERYEPNEVIAVLYTDEYGHLATAADYLPYGTYLLTETAPPEGYTADGENRTRRFTIAADGEYHTWGDEETAVKNRVVRFDVRIIKFRDTISSEDATDDVEPIAGVQFEIYLKSTGELVTTITTDADGVATTEDETNYPHGRLPYGTYVIHEVEETVPDGLSPVADFEVTGTIDGKIYGGIYKNDKPIEAPLTIVKVDGESAKIVGEEGFSFQILDKNKKVVSFDVHYPHPETITTFTTDASGTVTLPEKLPYGTYYIHEIAAPYGYLLSEDMQFTVTEYGAWTDLQEIEFADAPAKGKLVVRKYDKETEESLAGAVFAVFAKEDITTPDGTIHYAEGQYVETFTVGENGTGETGELYLGNYYVQEIQAPEGYCLDDTRYEFELNYADDKTPVVYAYYDAYNRPTTLRISKTDTEGQTLAGVTFDITRIADYPRNTAASANTADPAQASAQNAGTGTFVTDENGLIMEKYLVSGIYEIREASTLPGYILDETVRYFTVNENGFVFASDEKGLNLNADGRKSDTLTLTWVNDFTKWDFSKVDITGDKEIEGAKMQILDADGNVVYEWTSTENAHRISRIPAGTYTLVETQAPDGYVLSSSISFTVTETGEVQALKMTDKQLFVSKQTTSGEELPGAELVVKDADGNVADKWTSTRKPHAVNGLKVGETYTLTEKSAPDGYVAAEEIAFTVTDDGKNQQVAMIDRQLFVVKADTSVTGLAGAKLEVRDGKGNVVDSWTSDGSAHSVRGLKTGKTYTLAETQAPEGYALAPEVTFTVKKDAENDTLTLINKQVLVHKTDVTGETEVPGASMQVTDPDGRVMDSWMSDGTAHAVRNLSVGQTYILTETAAPQGYVQAGSIAFTVAEDEENQSIFMANKQVFVSKHSVTGEEELPGAELTVTDSRGEVADQWISTGERHAVSGLRVGETYTLTEKNAPEGYVIASSVEFTVEEDSAVQQVVMRDKQVFVSKRTVTGEAELPGAELTVTDSGGNVVDRWISADTPHAVNGLRVGESYTLTEIAAPEGYAAAKSISFTVADDFSIQQVTMIDKQVLVMKTDTSIAGLAGAAFEVRDQDGKVIDSWVSDGTAHVVSSLAVGETYVLVETEAPEGYVRASDITFTVSEDAENNEISMINKRVFVSKRDIAEEAELPGAKLTVTDQDGKTVDAWISSDTPHAVKGLETDGVYTLTETAAPDGYATSESVRFTVTDDAMDQTVVMYDEPIQVQISKRAITSEEELPGAELTVRKLDGTVIDQWVSAKEPHLIRQLPVGTYTLTEISAPDGYARAEQITFTVLDTAELQTVVMKDAPTVVEISKKDITDEEEIPGAEIIITDSEGNEIERWISDDKPHTIEQLPTGDYTLTEVTAPDGYSTAESVDFTVQDTGRIQHVTMYDSRTLGRLTIHKTDADTGENLAGAEFTLTNSETGEVAATLVTDVNGEASAEAIPIGRYENGALAEETRYLLKETKAPDGYQASGEEWEIIFDSDTGLAEVEVLKNISNTKIPEKTTVTDHAPKTGDMTNLILPILAFAVSGGCIVYSLWYFRKNRSKES